MGVFKVLDHRAVAGRGGKLALHPHEGIGLVIDPEVRLLPLRATSRANCPDVAAPPTTNGLARQDHEPPFDGGSRGALVYCAVRLSLHGLRLDDPLVSFTPSALLLLRASRMLGW